jgi:hypothetical protein
MNTYYADILERIAEPPTWFDEHAVPRFCPFSPRAIANIYADEAVLMRIACQACGREFDVCLSLGINDVVWAALRGEAVHNKTLADLVREGSIHYGDPPNVRCCDAGPTMNSEPMRVLEFWQRLRAANWRRVAALEVTLAPEDDEP